MSRIRTMAFALLLSSPLWTGCAGNPLHAPPCDGRFEPINEPVPATRITGAVHGRSQS
jgi:hypothetical protein